eukprot:gnl/Chilomastix_cuspidata/5580.p4 GENE.gnl/Chilomastix_cuspidata/5580~~gnl/Chilomastix_cuspidata/5580.p4  ORF type:complete len:114 (-),score=2.41 gnl/Chilomastix_cuspidata/5580:63-404(-)
MAQLFARAERLTAVVQTEETPDNAHAYAFVIAVLDEPLSSRRSNLCTPVRPRGSRLARAGEGRYPRSLIVRVQRALRARVGWCQGAHRGALADVVCRRDRVRGAADPRLCIRA